ncbi:MAG TPA: DoxX family protein [Steroidobacteraceae bacterium]|jgi:putative oxidoreductase|nr:DoxX family protein [Steroidobacteraceae bacterium]
MKLLLTLTQWHAALARWLDKLQPLALLAARLYVTDIFWRSGWLKLTSWESTLDLFRDEYHVPLLPPDVAAVMGTFGELFFPALLVLGLFGRVGAIGTFVVNAMAVISYSNVLLAEGYEAALGNHILWGALLLALSVFGPGKISLDSWLDKLLHHHQVEPAAVAAGDFAKRPGDLET